MGDVKMVVVDGIRYREEDAPKRATDEKAAPAPKNKARKTANKASSESE